MLHLPSTVCAILSCYCCSLGPGMSWNIILCGTVPRPPVVKVPDPSKWTIKELKQEMAKHVTHVSEDDVTFYLGKIEVPVDKVLKDCPGMKNGVGLAAGIKPFIINVCCPDVDVTLTIEIPRLESITGR